MRYLSLFSGIEACSVAWAPLGWECVAVAIVAGSRMRGMCITRTRTI